MRNFFSTAIFLLISSSAVFAREIPALTGPVIDDAHLLSAEEMIDLEGQLKNYLPTVQIQVWTIPALENDSIEDLSIHAVDKWKLGEQKKDNGVLILVAAADHRMRIEVGRGLEGNIPDSLAGRIVDYIMRPHFRNQEFAIGIEQAALEVYHAAGGQEVQFPRASRSDPQDLSPSELAILFLFILLFAFFFMPIAFFSNFNRRGGSGGGWSSGGWGSGGGGWSGGGGGFSGGGSSGSW